jgi:hypothetical protein
MGDCGVIGGCCGAGLRGVFLVGVFARGARGMAGCVQARGWGSIWLGGHPPPELRGCI